MSETLQSTGTRRLPGVARCRRAPHLSLPRPFILLLINKTGTTYTAQYVRYADMLSMTLILGMTRILRRKGLLAHIVRRQVRDARTRLRPGTTRHRVRDAQTRLKLSSTKNRAQKVQARLKPGFSHGYMNFEEKHTPYSWLPPHLRSLPAVTILREPISWQVSNYLHEVRSEYPFCRSILRNLEGEECEAFVHKYLGGELSIDAWCNISLEAHRHFRQNFVRRRRIRKFFNITLAADFPIGALGCQALIYLHRDPARVFALHTEEVEEYFASGRWREDLCQVYLLRQEQLREDLYSVMLERLGYRREILDAALELTPARMKVSPDQRKERAWHELEQKPWLREEILYSERIYLQYILPLAEAPQ